MAAMPAAPTAATVTIPGVQLLKVGRWYSKSHPDGRDYTAAELAAAVAAAQDPTVDHPVLKIGHRSKLAAAELGDGAPALGWLSNVRLEDDGNTLVADIVDVPAKLAAIIPKAFRRRSAEVAFGLRAASGKAYAMALTALSLLGEQPPAVKGLDDVTALYGLSGNEYDVDDLDAIDLAAGVQPEAAAALAAAIDRLDELNLSAGVRAVAVAELEAAAGVTVPTIPPARPTSRQNDANAATDPPEELGTMTIDEKALREKLGIKDEDDITAAVEKLLEGAKPAGDGNEPAGGGSGNEPAGGGEGGNEPAGTEGANEPELVGALSADTIKALEAAGVTIISKGALAELTKGAQAGTAVAEQLREAELAAVLDEAQRTGRITPAERGGPAKDGKEATGFYRMLEQDFEGGKALLSGMAPRFATAEVGADVAELAGLSGEAADAALAGFLDSIGAGDHVGLVK